MFRAQKIWAYLALFQNFSTEKNNFPELSCLINE